jgi:transcriptional regulator with XRE-family HTH domain
MSERVDVHLGKRLRWRRKSMGLTQQDVGAALGIRFQQVQKYESAANRMSAAVIWKLAALLEVDIHYFYDGLDHYEAPNVLGRSRKSQSEQPYL